MRLASLESAKLSTCHPLIQLNKVKSVINFLINTDGIIIVHLREIQNRLQIIKQNRLWVKL